jgi:hypothetical protein
MLLVSVDNTGICFVLHKCNRETRCNIHLQGEFKSMPKRKRARKGSVHF